MNEHDRLDKALTIFSVIYNLFATFFGMTWLFTSHLDSLKSYIVGSLEPSTPLILLAFFAAGMIGGATYCLKGIYERLSDAYTPNPKYTDEFYLGKEPTFIFNIKVWFFWYLYRPLLSGVLAMVIIALFSAGLFSLPTAADGKLNSLYFQVGIGFLIGYGTHSVLKKIEELINVLFPAKANTPAPQKNAPPPSAGSSDSAEEKK